MSNLSFAIARDMASTASGTCEHNISKNVVARPTVTKVFQRQPRRKRRTGLIQGRLLPKSSNARKRPNHTFRDNYARLNPSIIDLGILGSAPTRMIDSEFCSAHSTAHRIVKRNESSSA